MKPNWEDAPNWAEYLAQDMGGMWFWYGEKPHRYHGDTAWCCDSDVKFEHASYGDGGNPKWEETLENRKSCRNCKHREASYDAQGGILPANRITDVVCGRGNTVGSPDWRCSMYDDARGKVNRNDPEGSKQLGITATPVEFEVHDSSQELLAKVTMFDGTAANVEIVGVVDSKSWGELSSVIQTALDDMLSV